MAITVTSGVLSSSEPLSPVCGFLAISGISESGGGSRATCRDVTSTPDLLAAMTCGQVTPTPAGPLTSQSMDPAFGGSTFLSWSASAFHGAMTAPGSA